MFASFTVYPRTFHTSTARVFSPGLLSSSRCLSWSVVHPTLLLLNISSILCTCLCDFNVFPVHPSPLLPPLLIISLVHFSSVRHRGCSTHSHQYRHVIHLQSPFLSSEVAVDRVSARYNNAGLITVVYIFPFSLCRTTLHLTSSNFTTMLLAYVLSPNFIHPLSSTTVTRYLKLSTVFKSCPVVFAVCHSTYPLVRTCLWFSNTHSISSSVFPHDSMHSVKTQFMSSN